MIEKEWKNDVELNIRLRIAIVRKNERKLLQKKERKYEICQNEYSKKKQKREKETEETTHTKQTSNKRIEFWTWAEAWNKSSVCFKV